VRAWRPPDHLLAPAGASTSEATMPDTDFNPAEASTWLARGRRPAHAEALAKAWRDFPDLPPSAPVADRQARSRERVIATRPVFEEMRLEAEAERHATNFAFTENEVREGKANERDVAILNGRDRHGYDWDVANRYADGWYAAHVGWPHHYPTGSRAMRRSRSAARPMTRASRMGAVTAQTCSTRQGVRT